VAREALKRELKHDFRRAGRPAALTLGHIESFQKTAHVDKQPGKFRTDRIKRTTYVLPGGDDGIRQKALFITA
jgi:hypothetical protein